jgi:cytoskeletal protein CcmA (bactofilin family)
LIGATSSPAAFTAARDRAIQTGTSIIDSDLTIFGERVSVTSQNNLRVDGCVQGDVHGSQVTISRGGAVCGRISGNTINVNGKVDGCIIAATVILHETARVDAELIHQKLAILEGAEVVGIARLIRDPDELSQLIREDACAHQNGHPK